MDICLQNQIARLSSLVEGITIPNGPLSIINDNTPSDSTTFSSNKVNTLIGTGGPINFSNSQIGPLTPGQILEVNLAGKITNITPPTSPLVINDSIISTGTTFSSSYIISTLYPITAFALNSGTNLISTDFVGFGYQSATIQSCQMIMDYFGFVDVYFELQVSPGVGSSTIVNLWINGVLDSGYTIINGSIGGIGGRTGAILARPVNQWDLVAVSTSIAGGAPAPSVGYAVVKFHVI